MITINTNATNATAFLNALLVNATDDIVAAGIDITGTDLADAGLPPEIDEIAAPLAMSLQGGTRSRTRSWLDTVVTMVVDGVTQVYNFVSDVVNQLTQMLADLANEILNTIWAGVTWIANGLATAAEAVVDAVAAAVNWVIDWVNTKIVPSLSAALNPILEQMEGYVEDIGSALLEYLLDENESEGSGNSEDVFSAIFENQIMTIFGTALDIINILMLIVMPYVAIIAWVIGIVSTTIINLLGTTRESAGPMINKELGVYQILCNIFDLNTRRSIQKTRSEPENWLNDIGTVVALAGVVLTGFVAKSMKILRFKSLEIATVIVAFLSLILCICGDSLFVEILGLGCGVASLIIGVKAAVNGMQPLDWIGDALAVAATAIAIDDCIIR